MTKGAKCWISCLEEYLESAHGIFPLQPSHLIYLRSSWKVLPPAQSLPTRTKAGPVLAQDLTRTHTLLSDVRLLEQILKVPQQEKDTIKYKNKGKSRQMRPSWHIGGRSVWSLPSPPQKRAGSPETSSIFCGKMGVFVHNSNGPPGGTPGFRGGGGNSLVSRRPQNPVSATGSALMRIWKRRFLFSWKLFAHDGCVSESV